MQEFFLPEPLHLALTIMRNAVRNKPLHPVTIRPKKTGLRFSIAAHLPPETFLASQDLLITAIPGQSLFSPIATHGDIRPSQKKDPGQFFARALCLNGPQCGVSDKRATIGATVVPAPHIAAR